MDEIGIVDQLQGIKRKAAEDLEALRDKRKTPDGRCSVLQDDCVHPEEHCGKCILIAVAYRVKRG